MRKHRILDNLFPAATLAVFLLLAVNSLTVRGLQIEIEARDQVLHDIISSSTRLETTRLENHLLAISKSSGPNNHAGAKRRFAVLRNGIANLELSPLLDLGDEADLIKQRLTDTKQKVALLAAIMGDIDANENAEKALATVREVGTAVNQIRQITANRAAGSLQASRTNLKNRQILQVILFAALIITAGFWIGRLYRHIWTLRTETERAGKQVAKANALLRRDVVTGLMTRASLISKLPGFQSALAPGQQVSIINIQIVVPWTKGGSGHEAVRDSIIAAIADRIQNAVEFTHNAGYVARAENDGFFIALVCDGNNWDTVMDFAERLRVQIHRPVTVKSGTFPVTSISGIAPYDADSIDPGLSLQNAELATAEEIRTGRRHIGTYQPALRAVCERRSGIEQALLHALDQEECLPHFQPQFALASGHIVGVEALARWYHPGLGWIAPAEIIPIAEGNGLIVPLERKILEVACAQVQLLPDDITLAVNISVPHILNGDVPAMVADCLSRTGLPAERLKLEISAGSLPQIFEQVRGSLDQLKSLGVRLSLDNFGTPSAALAGVLQYQWDEVKIDTSLTGIASDSETGLSLMAMALTTVRSLGCDPLIEGIETVDQRDMLVTLGCPVGQGYLFGGPMAIDDLKALFFNDQPNIAQLLA